MTARPFLDVDPEIADALAGGRPVVALESTIIAHGMPYPQNLETASRVEAAVRAGGAVPATIAVLDGRIRIGLDAAGLERVARSPGMAKISRRDLPVALARRADGATTVAATMLCAHLAGIAVFVTGGLGGVHRGAETSFDVSADLEELAQTPVAVVCAGAKAILDLPKTLEYLETRGVPVIGYGTDRFPAFYSRDSGLAAPHRCDGPEEVAAVLHAQRLLGYPGGSVIAAPVPETEALRRDEIDPVIEAAVAEAERRGVKGRDLTPFLLARIAAVTGGRSLETNIALVLNNAGIGARIAAACAALTAP